VLRQNDSRQRGGVASPREIAVMENGHELAARWLGPRMRKRVLILDDQEYLRDIMATILADAGYPAAAVETADEALRALDELHPELLVLDVSLPKVGGLEFLDQLRAQPAWATLPVLIVSGDPTRLVAAEGRPNVVALTKPFDASDLVAEVARFLQPAALPQSA
jgi:DNA-binding response OmpR family regulator